MWEFCNFKNYEPNAKTAKINTCEHIDRYACVSMPRHKCPTNLPYILEYIGILFLSVRTLLCSLVPKREAGTDSVAVAKRKPYSPFRTENSVDYAIARADDLVNWARKVGDVFIRLCPS